MENDNEPVYDEENPLQYFETVAHTANPMTHATPAFAPYTSTAGYRDLGGSAPYMDPALLKRPARKQVSTRSYYEDHASDGQDYNIWYHKRPGFRQDKFEERENPGSRCNVLTDAGKTKANKKSPFCIYFAHGRCSMGPDCQYHHRVPTFEDEDRHDLAHDIFGRERHATDKDDMSGVGNFTRECRTLYVGCVKMTGNIEEAIKRHFEEWGPIEYSRAIHTKSIAFVRFYLRASAEFAKEAMTNQSLDNNDVLMIRWATDDTNPIAKEYEEKRKHVMASDALNKRLKIMGAADQATMYYQITGQYPNTDGQFAQSAQDAYAYEFAGYSVDHTNEQHPYASLAAARKAALEQHQAAVAAGLADPSSAPTFDPNDPYAAYYYQQYGYEGYAPHTEAQVQTEFVPTYRTAAEALAEQEEEDEEDEERPSLPPGIVAPVAPVGEGQEKQGEEAKQGEGQKEGAGGDSDLQSFYATLETGASEASSEATKPATEPQPSNKEKTESAKSKPKASTAKPSAPKASATRSSAPTGSAAKGKKAAAKSNKK